MALEEPAKQYSHFGPFGAPAALPLITSPTQRKRTFTTIPTVDLSLLSSPSPSPSALQDLAKEVATACQDVGFFYAAMHGVDEQLIDDAFTAVRAFFDQNLETKLKVSFHQSKAYRGYEPVFETRHETWGKGDMKQSFSFDHMPHSQWPSPSTSPPNFQKTLTTYLDSVESFSQKLLRLFALALHLPETYFDDHFSESGASIRCLHYPPQPSTETEIEVGIGAHTDYSWFTLVAQYHDSSTTTVGGLEAQNANGEWIPVSPKPHQFVVNIGDSMQWITNGRFLSTRHRVVNRHHNSGPGNDRYSMAFFKSPSDEATLRVVETCSEEGRGYGELSVREYAEMRRRGSRIYHPAVIGKKAVIVDKEDIDVDIKV